MSRHGYTPRAGSLPSQLIAFFQRAPDEELTTEDIADKFDVTQGNIHTNLALAVGANMLERARNADGDYMYRPGKQLPRFADDTVMHEGASKPSKVQRAARQAEAVHVPIPAASTIAIDDHVPIPNIRGNLDTDYTPLLKKLQPTQSFALPLSARHLLVKQIVVVHKAKQGRYTTRINRDKQEVRVWRTA